MLDLAKRPIDERAHIAGLVDDVTDLRHRAEGGPGILHGDRGDAAARKELKELWVLGAAGHKAVAIDEERRGIFNRDELIVGAALSGIAQINDELSRTISVFTLFVAFGVAGPLNAADKPHLKIAASEDSLAIYRRARSARRADGAHNRRLIPRTIQIVDRAAVFIRIRFEPVFLATAQE